MSNHEKSLKTLLIFMYFIIYSQMPGRGRKRTRESEGTPKAEAKRQRATKENSATVTGKKKGRI